MNPGMFKDYNVEEQAEFWNSRAKPCSHYERRSSYADEFLKLSGILPGESVFDMGCGSGTLCLPLADDGHEVFCADFSDNMLKSVQDVIDEEHLTLLTLKKLTWQEDWDAHELPVCDLAFASRCMFGLEPAEAVQKLSARARRRVCVTLPVNPDMFKKPGAPYYLGDREEMNAFALECINTAREQGYDPVSTMMEDDSHGDKGWLFIKWDKGDGSRCHFKEKS